MHKEILSREQLGILPLLKNFSADFGLAGGTAIALRLGHRRSLAVLAALKAYALGRRSKWKDYVDLYFIMKNKVGLKKIINQAEKIFGRNFNEKIFRAQLAYFKDLDYSEKVEYLKGFEVPDEVIKKELIKISLS
ncbi:MAG: hypothetical protein PHO56_05270 [Patescibacteria group bacterium]|nr:hypothetical protein [Patescibacteria group bacterium]